MSRVLLAILTVFSLGLHASIAHAESTFVTRAEASMMLLRSAHLPLQNNPTLLYPDAIPGEWYVPYLHKALSLGMIEADHSSGLITPHGSVNRADFLKMLSIAFDLPKNLTYQYMDIPSDARYRPYIGVAYREGLFRDTSNPLLLHPSARVTQDEAVDVIRSISVMRNRDASTPASTPSPEISTTQTSSAAPQIPPSPLEGKSLSTGVLPNFAESPRMVKESLRRTFAARSNILDASRTAILQGVNEERTKAKIPILRHNPLLAKAAQAHAKDMAQRGYFSHFTPEGLSYVDRVRSAGYLDSATFQCPCAPTINVEDLLKNQGNPEPSYALRQSGNACECKARFALGENIAKGQLTPIQAMKDWMQSENHRLNILSGAFDEIGIGIFNDIWVQEFGKLEAP